MLLFWLTISKILRLNLQFKNFQLYFFFIFTYVCYLLIFILMDMLCVFMFMLGYAILEFLSNYRYIYI